MTEQPQERRKNDACVHEAIRELNLTVQELRADVSEMKPDVDAITTIINDANAVFAFFRRVGNTIRWLALTAAGVISIWATIKGGFHDLFSK